ncbi:MAG: phosphate uptake regulator PhoU [Alphaproteobacteria bacterium]|nr:phosphate uptake regulator PhoU [Alphaproteobacteria bacterium]MBV9372184.1 phosphate uptake regulator PhoU [Alphaproteobacteria bacterium]MBV9902315.1 phosphate uptake regulator PhoU [Alphaproteobacteria bacterium]
MAAANHTVKAFDEDLEELRAMVALLGGWGEAAVAAAVHALRCPDDGAPARAVDLAGHIDTLAQDVEQRAICLIALRAPMADDLRGIVAALKIAQLIQRLGCLTLDMTLRLELSAPPPVPDGVREAVAHLGEISTSSLRSSLDSFGAQDPAAAAAAAGAVDTAEALFRACYRMSLAGSGQGRPAVHLMLAAQSLTLAAALSSDVARVVHFAATGDRLPRASLRPVTEKAVAHG